MRRIFLYFIVSLFLLPACSKRTGNTTRIVKPKYHHRFYDRKKNKHTKRTKSLKVQN